MYVSLRVQTIFFSGDKTTIHREKQASSIGSELKQKMQGDYSSEVAVHGQSCISRELPSVTLIG